MFPGVYDSIDLVFQIAAPGQLDELLQSELEF